MMIRRLAALTGRRPARAAVEARIQNWLDVRRRQAEAAEKLVDKEMLISKWRAGIDEHEDVIFDDVELAAAQVRGGVATLLAAEPTVGPEARDAIASALRTAVIASVPDSRGPIGGFHQHIPQRLRGRGLPKALQLRYPLAIAVTVLCALTASLTIAAGHTRLALLPLTLAVVADLLDGAFAKRDPRRKAAGMYTACLASHFMDLLLLGGFVLYLSSRGDPTLALWTGAATTVAIFGSFTRAAALQVGVRISRNTAERFVRVGGVYAALVLGVPLVAPIALAAFGVMEVAYVLWVVWMSNVRSMAVVVERGTSSGAQSAWWGWQTSPFQSRHSWWGWDTSATDQSDDPEDARAAKGKR